MATDQAAPPLYPLTDDDHGALVVVAAIIFLVYAIVGLITKLFIRLNITSMQNHDFVLLAGAILYFLQTILIIVACNYGLGQHQDTLSESSLEGFSKFLYASRILAVCVDCCTKISLCLLIKQIDGSGKLNVANMVLGGVILVWAITGFFATIFQCPLPEPWLATSLEQCPNRGPIFVFNGVMNILTDLALCALPIAMMWHVQTTLKRKAVVSALFGTRIIVPILTIPTLSNARYLYEETSDVTWDVVSSTIWLQIALGLSVLTACIPSLKGIIDSLLGATSVAAIGAPYDLRDSGKKSGLEITVPSGTGSNQASKDASALKLSRQAKSVHNSLWSSNRDREVDATYVGKESSRESGSESVRKLTEGVIVVRDEFEINYDERRRSLSRADSRESSDNGFRSSSYHH